MVLFLPTLVKLFSSKGLTVRGLVLGLELGLGLRLGLGARCGPVSSHSGENVFQ